MFIPLVKWSNSMSFFIMMFSKMQQKLWQKSTSISWTIILTLFFFILNEIVTIQYSNMENYSLLCKTPIFEVPMLHRAVPSIRKLIIHTLPAAELLLFVTAVIWKCILNLEVVINVWLQMTHYYNIVFPHPKSTVLVQTFFSYDCWSDSVIYWPSSWICFFFKACKRYSNAFASCFVSSDREGCI